MGLKTLLEEALSECQDYDRHYPYGLRNPIYSFTTENISGYINHFNLKNRSLLTVGSSGDQVINAALVGCEDITLYDTNPYSRYYFYLKCAGLIALTKEEFLEFFRYRNFISPFKLNTKVFNMESYKKIKPILMTIDFESFIFFDVLFNNHSGVCIREVLFDAEEDKSKVLEKSNLYLSSETLYDEAKYKMMTVSPTFICGDIMKMPDKPKYDNIWLSNIATWMQKEEEIVSLLEVPYKSLNEKGMLLYSYLYMVDEKEEAQPIYHVEDVRKSLRKRGYKSRVLKFDGVDFDSLVPAEQKDAVIIVKK